MGEYKEMLRSSSKRNSILPVIGGLLGLAVAMGIGRFAYTPLLPAMRLHTHFSTAFAGVLASWNYFGYLVGAILVAMLPARLQTDMRFRYRIVVLGLIGSVVSTACMGLTSSHDWWCVSRGVGGLFSAVVLVISSSLVMDWLARRGNVQEAGILYSGVGVGIAITGILVPYLTSSGGWQLGWLGLGCLGGVLTILASVFLRTVGDVNSNDHHSTNKHQPDLKSPFPLWSITLVYGLEGLGYIVMATFITDFFHDEKTVAWLGTVSWVFVGLAGAPSTWLWTKVARVWGGGRATMTAFMTQAVGILLPVIHSGIWEAIIGSILFGGTFMGITSLALSIGRMCSPDRAGTVIGMMTTMFSIGQVLGPILAGMITTQTHTFRLAMMLSGFTILAAALLLWCTRKE
ncbi:YbfB/YjiJ family MFS transporter [Alicyclobacillus dauci]|uniref:YbfB/YjiJ family MFS transporter n=1 Tax=Alicyclobacillus dauci TaxID=1475485 RepID=A0ABY6Z4U5_9BACL|nr:YbfB/YjiJ family MFS transporter [Alicyclobacillus dauci]WAH37902.1 YbfB/YjiJ family MFS transporter [Alicyclobacillus dauci]